jgi:hypothetical protein
MRNINSCFLILCFPMTLVAHERFVILRAPLADNVADLAEQIQDALPWKTDPYDSQGGPSVSGAYAALFKKAGDAGLPALQTGKNDSIAIQAAWHEVALTVPEEMPVEQIRPNQRKLDWFIGFLEGRIRVKPPEWWAESVHNAGANRRDNIHFGRVEVSPYHSAGWHDVLAPLDTTLTREDNKLMIRIAKQKMHIPTEIVKLSELGRTRGRISAAFGKSNCYFAIHDDSGYPYNLHCFDPETGAERWNAGVWGSWWGHSTGVSHCFVSVIESNDRVVVFGEAGIGIHVEAFAVKDGANLLRFASSY